MGEEVIILTDLTKKYGKFTAVDHICLLVRKGEIFGLLGPNGAGKSTTILMMLGLTEPTSGSVSICGINANHQLFCSYACFFRYNPVQGSSINQVFDTCHIIIKANVFR